MIARGISAPAQACRQQRGPERAGDRLLCRRRAPDQRDLSPRPRWPAHSWAAARGQETAKYRQGLAPSAVPCMPSAELHDRAISVPAEAAVTAAAPGLLLATSERVMMIGESPLCPADQTSSCPGSKISPSRERRGDAVTGHPSFAQGQNFRAAGHRGRQRSTSRRTSRSWPACEPGLIEPSATALWVSETTA